MAVDRRRWTLGLAVSEDCRAVSGAAVAAYGSGLEARVQVTAVARARVPPGTRALYRELARGKIRRGPAAANVLAAELADVEAAVVQQLIAAEPLVRDHALCVGVHDPGLWHGTTAADRAYVGLCDAARLAELTGLNVIDALPARDLAQGGRGGPLLAAPYWMLLHHPDRARALIELGATSRVTWLPAARDSAGIGRMAAGEAGPGCRLLNRVARTVQGSSGQTGQRADQLAAQGCLRPDLLESWFSVQTADTPWHPLGVPQGGLAKTVIAAIRQGAVNGHDALCTITHGIGRAVMDCLAELAAPGSAAEVLITGPGSRNGLLLQQLGRGLADAKLLAEPQVGVAAGGLEPAAVALLAQLFLEQLPGNLPAITGAQVPRVLGQLTPGSPPNWLRLVREMARHQPVVTLRTAM